MDQSQLIDLLDTVPDPLTGRGLVRSGRISGVILKDKQASFALTHPPHERAKYQQLAQQLEEKIKAESGIQACHVLLRSEKPAPQRLPKLENIKKIIAVGSGKGGVGKSTVALNLALGWAQQGLKVGLLDADIYGPSIPTMLEGSRNLFSGTPPASCSSSNPSPYAPAELRRDKHVATDSSVEKKLHPVEVNDLKMMSIGLLVPDYASLVWRGPMIQKALVQMLWGADWGELDVLVIDLPPGTGDVQITLCQKAELAGAIVVSTPQDLSLMEAQKAVDMFQKVRVPVLGLVENMSSFQCPHCGEASAIFDQNTIPAAAKQLDIPFLGSIPLDMAIRQEKIAPKAFESVLEKVRL